MMVFGNVVFMWLGLVRRSRGRRFSLVTGLTERPKVATFSTWSPRALLVLKVCRESDARRCHGHHRGVLLLVLHGDATSGIFSLIPGPWTSGLSWGHPDEARVTPDHELAGTDLVMLITHGHL